MFKESSHLRVRVQDVCVHVEKFCTSCRHTSVTHTVFRASDSPSCIPEDLFLTFLPAALHIFSLPKLVEFHDLCQCLRFSHTKFYCQFCFLIGEHARKSPVIRIVSGNLFQSQFLRNLSDLFAQFRDRLPERFVRIRGESWIDIIRIQLFFQFFLHPPTQASYLLSDRPSDIAEFE